MVPTKKRPPAEDSEVSEKLEWTEEKADLALTMYDNGKSNRAISEAIGIPTKYIPCFLIDYILLYKCDWEAYDIDLQDDYELELREERPRSYMLEPARDEDDPDSDGSRRGSQTKGYWTRKKTVKMCYLYDDGVSYEEIGKQLGLGINGVRKFVKEHRLTPGLWRPWRDRRPVRTLCFKDEPEILLVPRHRPLVVTDYIEKKKQKKQQSS